MKYIVRITENGLGLSEYIAEGRTYVVNGEPYVPFTELWSEAKRYNSRKLAERASNRSGVNMHGHIEVLEVEE